MKFGLLYLKSSSYCVRFDALLVIQSKKSISSMFKIELQSILIHNIYLYCSLYTLLMLYLFIFSQSDIIATFSWLKMLIGWIISLNINMLKINRKVDLFFSYMKQHTDQTIDSIFNVVVFSLSWMYRENQRSLEESC